LGERVALGFLWQIPGKRIAEVRPHITAALRLPSGPNALRINAEELEQPRQLLAVDPVAFLVVVVPLLRLYRPEGEPEPKPKAREALFNEKATVDGVSALLVGSASRGLLGARWPS